MGRRNRMSLFPTGLRLKHTKEEEKALEAYWDWWSLKHCKKKNRKVNISPHQIRKKKIKCMKKEE